MSTATEERSAYILEIVSGPQKGRFISGPVDGENQAHRTWSMASRYSKEAASILAHLLKKEHGIDLRARRVRTVVTLEE